MLERSRQDPKFAAAAADVGHFEDDEDGNLVRLERPRAAAAAPGLGSASIGATGAGGVTMTSAQTAAAAEAVKQRTAALKVARKRTVASTASASPER